MAPNTRSTRRDTTPPRHQVGTEHDTPSRVRFQSALKQYGSITRAAKAEKIAPSTAKRWSKQFKQYGSPALRRTRKLSKRLGRPSKLSPSKYKMLISPTRNPVRDQIYEAQIAFHNLGVTKRTLRYGLDKNTKGAKRYKMPYINKVLTPKNLQQRVAYGNRRLHKGVMDFWQYCEFTDEFHLDPLQMKQSHMLREQGTRNNAENFQQRPKLEGVTLHVAGWVTWDYRIEELIFYNEKSELPRDQQPQKKYKPWKRPSWSEARYQQALEDWEASKGPTEHVEAKGNSMTQKYYVDNIQPHYIKAINAFRLQDSSHKGFYLVEDGDPSHGMRKRGSAQRARDDNWITNIEHPPNSPDLNPIEGIWLILKERVRQRTWHSIAELKQVVQEEWRKIDQNEIRARIVEMPWRCRRLVATGGAPIRSEMW